MRCCSLVSGGAAQSQQLPSAEAAGLGCCKRGALAALHACTLAVWAFGKLAEWIVRAVWQSRMLGVAKVSPARSASRRLCSALTTSTAPVGLRCACDQGIRWDLMTTARWCNLLSNSPQSIVEMLGRPPRDRGEEQIKLLQHAS
jgi:hypothetical protein